MISSTKKKKKGYGLEIKTFHGKRRSMKRCVILNPKAGSVKDLDAVIKQLGRLEASSFHLTKNEGAAKAFAREAVRDQERTADHRQLEVRISCQLAGSLGGISALAEV